MNPIFLDLHIHTSEDPNNLNKAYDIDTLLDRINKVSCQSDFLISLTDHNIINKDVYLKIIRKTHNILLGVELHIQNYKQKPPYHCHIFFNTKDINSKIIDDINIKLDSLYPSKIINKDTTSIPKLEDIIREFDSYEFVLLPHGGQSHSTFNKSIPEGIIFDTTLERSIYYNQFDGFTARSNDGLEESLNYFRRLGINDFINLITCTDNYNPKKYPEAKISNAGKFIPTWMLSLPTFEGLRLSLSESSRLIYNDIKPSNWSEYIQKVSLKNDLIEIDAELTPGLNVVIGGSSSGKTLFVDSIYKKLSKDLKPSAYSKFNVSDILIKNPSGNIPHYISQNYIITIINNAESENKIDDIDIIKNVFPGVEELSEIINQGLAVFKKDLNILINCIKVIEQEEKFLFKTSVFSRLIQSDDVKENILNLLIPSQEIIEKIEYKNAQYNKHIQELDSINKFLEENGFIESDPSLVNELKKKLTLAFQMSLFENIIRAIIINYKEDIDNLLSIENKEQQTKKKTFEKLLQSMKKYSEKLNLFQRTINSISRYSIECKTQEVKSMGHTLFIENNFKLTKEKFLEVINKFLTSENKINSFDQISPQKLYENLFSKKSPKVSNYDEFESRVYNEFERMNKKTYRIVTSDGKDFDNLSAGWKTSILLDLILGYEGDLAPLIIDQPEDNLATNYINHGLINAIKKIKSKKQVILVSHNATIPMLGDAQNIILCQNKDKIYIYSSRLEGQIEGKNMLDYIAEITDGGKPSIKKRVKKYNLKKYKD